MNKFSISACSALALGLSGAILPGAAWAQGNVGERVAAIVNDDPISTFDVRQRMRLMVITQGGQVPESAMAQLQQQALRDLIEERLKLQEAARFDLKIPDDAIADELAEIAGSGGGSVAQLQADLAAQGIDIETLRTRIRADLSWQQLVRGRYGSRINVTSGEVHDMMEKLKETAQQEQFLISEVCLPVAEEGDAERMYDIGVQMIDQMRQGVPFRAIAQQYSACPSAARGGDLGWLRAAELDSDLADVVTRLGVGNVSRPLPHDGMLKLFAVRQKREAAAAGEPSYQVVYFGAPDRIGEDAFRAALTRVSATTACRGARFNADLGAEVSVAVLPPLPESQFQTVFHDVLASLETEKVSEPVQSEGSFHAVVLCEKDEGFGLPSRRVIENRLEAEELELISRRYLRDVERNSAVEVRMRAGG